MAKTKAEQKAERLATGRRLANERVNFIIGADGGGKNLRGVENLRSYGLPAESIEAIIATLQSRLDQTAAALRGTAVASDRFSI
jgi:hypothetical protein